MCFVALYHLVLHDTVFLDILSYNNIVCIILCYFVLFYSILYHIISYSVILYEKGDDIILLSAFDGVGAACYIIEELFGRPRLALAWEIDKACCRVLETRLPWVVRRGDITKETVQTRSPSSSPTPTPTKSAWSFGRAPRHVKTSPKSRPVRVTRARRASSSSRPSTSSWARSGRPLKTWPVSGSVAKSSHRTDSHHRRGPTHRRRRARPPASLRPWPHRTGA